MTKASERLPELRPSQEIDSQDLARKLIQDCLALLSSGNPECLEELREAVL